MNQKEPLETPICNHDWIYGGVGAPIGNLYNKCKVCKLEVNLPEIHDECGPFPDFSSILRAPRPEGLFSKPEFVSITGPPESDVIWKNVALVDPESSDSMKKMIEARDRCIDRMYQLTAISKKVKCQRSGCGKTLSSPTNHRCDLCYSYHQ